MHHTNEELQAEIRATYNAILNGTPEAQAIFVWKLQMLVDRLAWQTKSGKTF